MLYIYSAISILEVLIVVIPSLLSVAFVTVAERKTMASMQRRLGPNSVGWYGLLQAFADALKLLLKEYISPSQANFVLFFIGPIITLIFSLLGYAVIPYSPGLAILDFNLSILYALAVSSLATYGILLAGWSANSKYAFLGSVRSIAQLISYELILTSVILLVVLLAGSFNIGVIIESQRYIWFIFPIFPLFIIFFIGAVAETNRAPFDLAEAESELVSGFMTEHSAVVFVFFFLAEYASIVLICIITSILFLGGYLLDSISNIFIICEYIVFCCSILFSFMVALVEIFLIVKDYFFSLDFDYLTKSIIYVFNIKSIIEVIYNVVDMFESVNIFNWGYIFKLAEYYSEDTILTIRIYSTYYSELLDNPLLEGLINALVLGVKSSIMIFIFIWVRASFPRMRYDALMSYCWTVLLPILIGFFVFIPFFIYNFHIIPCNIIIL